MLRVSRRNNNNNNSKHLHRWKQKQCFVLRLFFLSWRLGNVFKVGSSWEKKSDERHLNVFNVKLTEPEQPAPRRASENIEKCFLNVVGVKQESEEETRLLQLPYEPFEHALTSGINNNNNINKVNRLIMRNIERDKRTDSDRFRPRLLTRGQPISTKQCRDWCVCVCVCVCVSLWDYDHNVPSQHE